MKRGDFYRTDDPDSEGRNLVYKLSLYSQVRDQINDIGADNNIELRIRFNEPVTNGNYIFPMIPGGKYQGPESIIKVNANDNINENLFVGSGTSYNNTWSLYLLPDMYSETEGSGNFVNQLPIIYVNHYPGTKDGMYDLRDNDSFSHKKINHIISESASTADALRTYHDLWIKYFDDITLPMMMGFYLFTNRTPIYDGYALDMRRVDNGDFVLYNFPSDTSGTFLYSSEVELDWWKNIGGTTLYSLFKSGTRYEDMIDEVYPTNVLKPTYIDRTVDTTSSVDSRKVSLRDLISSRSYEGDEYF